jgi:sodium/hydrogen exchanger-like protein 6/7
MSRRTQLTTKYLFQVLAQLSENFIFIYLGLSLFTDDNLTYEPLLIMVTVLAVCAARWVAVFPLSRAINWFIRYRARRRGREATDELPYNYQAMLFWAGLRGAVGVALAALLTGDNVRELKATVLVVVVLTVIIFGGTTARMLEIMGIRTGVVEEVDSDDEFDIENIGGGNYYKRPGGTGIGFVPGQRRGGGSVPLDSIGNGRANGARNGRSGWASGHRSPNSAGGTARPTSLSRKGSGRNGEEVERSDLLGGSGNNSEDDLDSDIDTSDLPPPAPRRRSSPIGPAGGSGSGEPVFEGRRERSGTGGEGHPITATAAIRQLFSSEDPSALFRQLDEDYIKPKLLLDGGPGGRGGNGGPS